MSKAILILEGDRVDGVAITRTAKVVFTEEYGSAFNLIKYFERLNSYLPSDRWIRTVNVEDWKEIDVGPGRQWSEEDLARLDDRSIQKLMREVDSQELAKALKGAKDETKKKIFQNMSKRAAEMLKEDMEYMGPVRKSDQEDSMSKIFRIIENLVDEGEIPDPSEKVFE